MKQARNLATKADQKAPLILQVHYNRTMSLKVFDLQCENGHVFEGWFSSHEDYHNQLERGILSCPICDSRQVVRQVSAARINKGVSAPSHHAAAEHAPALAHMPAELQAQVLQQLRQLVRSAEDVGERFAEEARAIHYGDAPERSIRGVASAEERAALAEEGIAALPLPAMLNDDQLH